MNDRWLDGIARAVASGTSRRRVLRALVGGVAGGLATALTVPPVAAAKRYGAPCQSDAACATGYCFRSPNGNDRCLCPNPRQQPRGAPFGRCCAEGEGCVEGRCRCTRGGMCGTRFLACDGPNTLCVCSAAVGRTVCAEFLSSFCVDRCAACPAGTLCSTTTCCASGAACVVPCGMAAPQRAATGPDGNPFLTPSVLTAPRVRASRAPHTGHGVEARAGR